MQLKTHLLTRNPVKFSPSFPWPFHFSSAVAPPIPNSTLHSCKLRKPSLVLKSFITYTKAFCSVCRAHLQCNLECNFTGCCLTCRGAIWKENYTWRFVPVMLWGSTLASTPKNVQGFCFLLQCVLASSKLMTAKRSLE